MTDRPDHESLRELGESSTNVARAWAGAEDYLSRGLLVWTRRAVEGDQLIAVKAALAACSLVVASYPVDGGDAQAPRRYIDDMLTAIVRWLDNPSHNHKEMVRSSLDTTRQLHAWQGHERSPQFWTLEAVDHTCLAVWSGERSSYIVPLDFATSAARAVTCVLHALVARGESEARAIDAVVGAVLTATA